MSDQAALVRNRRRRRPARSAIISLPDRVIDGYQYRYGGTLKNGNQRLICSKAESEACSARGTLSSEEEFTFNRNRNVHCHEPDENANCNARFLCDLYKASTRQFRTLQKIYDDIAPLHQESAAILDFESVRHRMQYWQQNAKLPDIKTCNDFYTYLGNSDYSNINRHNLGKIDVQFRINEANQHTAIVLVDKDFINKIDIDELFVQSTTAVLPANVGAIQMTCISTHFADHILPICWVLVLEKTPESCQNLAEMLISLKTGLYPLKILHDFDDDYFKSFETTFPGATKKGTFMSHCMIMIKEANRLNIDLNDNSTMIIFAKIVALSLLPPQKIEPAFQWIVSCMNDEQFTIFQDLLNYYNQSWINKIGVVNFSFFNDERSLLKNTDLILKHMKNNVRRGCTAWNFLEQVLSFSERNHYHYQHWMEKGSINCSSNKIKNVFNGKKNFKLITKCWENIGRETGDFKNFLKKIATMLVPTLRNFIIAGINIPSNFNLVKIMDDLEAELNLNDVVRQPNNNLIEEATPAEIRERANNFFDVNSLPLGLNDIPDIEDSDQEQREQMEEARPQEELPIEIQPIEEERPIEIQPIEEQRPLEIYSIEEEEEDDVDDEEEEDDGDDEEEDDDDEGEKCRFCIRRRAIMQYSPCNHIISCEKCNETWFNRRKDDGKEMDCIICRAKILYVNYIG